MAASVTCPLRTYGGPPFVAAVIHGGPGAGGEMAPVARELAPHVGVVEPIQTATSLDGQVAELLAVLEAHAQLPVALVGFSWGAWLSYILAARHPAVVKKLILVGSGPFEEAYVAQLHETRMRRLSEAERAEFESLIQALGDPASEDKDDLLARLGALASQTDGYAPLADFSNDADLVGSRGDIFQQVWQEAAELRRSGRLLALGQHIRCPVVAIHGDYDPHPAEGVQQPLSAVLDDFRLILLETCGHTPWIERDARDRFFNVLKQAVKGDGAHTQPVG